MWLCKIDIASLLRASKALVVGHDECHYMYNIGVGYPIFRKHIAQRNTSFKNFQLGATTYLNRLTRVRDSTLSDIVHVWVCFR